MKRRNRKLKKKNLNLFLLIKVNKYKVHVIYAEILDMFCQNVLKHHLLQKINGHSKQRQKNHYLIHRELNHNLVTKKDTQLNMNKTVFRRSDHGQQEHIISFKKKVYSLMCWVILLGIYIAKQIKNKRAWQNKTSIITSYLTVDTQFIYFAFTS